MNENDKNAFTSQVRIRAQEKMKELLGIEHEIKGLEVQRERAKTYLESLNQFLEAEGERPESLKEARPSGVGKPGNRSKNMPVRRVEWEGKSMNYIVGHILDASPDVIYHFSEIAPKIYEIQNELDLRKVAKNLRSTMQRGAKLGLWNKVGRAKFKGKVSEGQREPINV